MKMAHNKYFQDNDIIFPQINKLKFWWFSIISKISIFLSIIFFMF